MNNDKQSQIPAKIPANSADFLSEVKKHPGYQFLSSSSIQIKNNKKGNKLKKSLSALTGEINSGKMDWLNDLLRVYIDRQTPSKDSVYNRAAKYNDKTIDSNLNSFSKFALTLFLNTVEYITYFGCDGLTSLANGPVVKLLNTDFDNMASEQLSEEIKNLRTKISVLFDTKNKTSFHLNFIQLYNDGVFAQYKQLYKGKHKNFFQTIETLKETIIIEIQTELRNKGFIGDSEIVKKSLNIVLKAQQENRQKSISKPPQPVITKMQTQQDEEPSDEVNSGDDDQDNKDAIKAKALQVNVSTPASSTIYSESNTRTTAMSIAKISVSMNVFFNNEAYQNFRAVFSSIREKITTPLKPEEIEAFNEANVWMSRLAKYDDQQEIAKIFFSSSMQNVLRQCYDVILKSVGEDIAVNYFKAYNDMLIVIDSYRSAQTASSSSSNSSVTTPQSTWKNNVIKNEVDRYVSSGKAYKAHLSSLFAASPKKPHFLDILREICETEIEESQDKSVITKCEFMKNVLVNINYNNDQMFLMVMSLQFQKLFDDFLLNVVNDTKEKMLLQKSFDDYRKALLAQNPTLTQFSFDKIKNVIQVKDSAFSEKRDNKVAVPSSKLSPHDTETEAETIAKIGAFNLKQFNEEQALINHIEEYFKDTTTVKGFTEYFNKSVLGSQAHKNFIKAFEGLNGYIQKAQLNDDQYEALSRINLATTMKTDPVNFFLGIMRDEYVTDIKKVLEVVNDKNLHTEMLVSIEALQKQLLSGDVVLKNTSFSKIQEAVDVIYSELHPVEDEDDSLTESPPKSGFGNNN